MPLRDVYTLTTEEIRAALKIEHTLETDLLEQLREVAFELVEQFIGYDFTAEDYSGEPIDPARFVIPPTMETAILQIIGHLYEHRGDELDINDPIPATAKRLLFPHKLWFGL